MGEGKKRGIILSSNQATESSLETAWKKKKICLWLYGVLRVGQLTELLGCSLHSCFRFHWFRVIQRGVSMPCHFPPLLPMNHSPLQHNHWPCPNQCSVQQCSGFFNSELLTTLFLRNNLAWKTLLRRIVVQALHTKYWIKHWILNKFKCNFTLNNKGLS